MAGCLLSFESVPHACGDGCAKAAWGEVERPAAIFDVLVKDFRGCCTLWTLTGRGIVLRDKRVCHMLLIKKFLPNEALRIWVISVRQVPPPQPQCHSFVYSV